MSAVGQSEQENSIPLLDMAHNFGEDNEHNPSVPNRRRPTPKSPCEQDLFIIELMRDGFLITCGIQVINLTTYSLTNPQTTINRGAIDYPPSDIPPNAKGMLIARKTSNTATGTSGTVSWNIEGKKRLVLMWCVPFDNNIFSNWMAVGLTKTHCGHHNKWYDQMYYDSSATNLLFHRKKFRWDTNEVTIDDEDFTVSGTMGTGHKAQLKVIISERALNH